MVIARRWSLATGPVVMLGGAFAGVAALSLLWEKYSKSEREPRQDSK